MKQITDDEYELFQRLQNIFIHANPEKFAGAYFICGSSGVKDSQGLPELIMVCPAMGLNHSVFYQKVEKIE